MLRKLILACAATVALGAAAFTPSAASAHGWYGGHGGWHGGGFYRGWGGPRFYGRPVYFGGGYGGCYASISQSGGGAPCLRGIGITSR